ncbi:MAG: homoserine kinase [Chloroflexi bacterium]|nr:homoserine kinase [Chloroflexota bacterium]
MPATTANLGPGFDCLGMALDIWNTVRLEAGSSGVRVSGEGEGSLNLGRDNLVIRAAESLFRAIGKPTPQLSLTCDNAVPLGRGLGSSSAAAVGGLVAANALCENPLTQDEVLALAVEIEGHPDNVTPALLGGCQIVVQDGDALVTSAVPLASDLWAVLYIPSQQMPTQQARGLLGPTVSRADAVFNMGRAALLVNALSMGDVSLLRTATQDRLHQPARGVLFPAMARIIRAALDAGAVGAFLSGAGSTILALTVDREMTVGYEMADMADKAGVPGDVKVTKVSPQGAHVVSAG